MQQEKHTRKAAAILIAVVMTLAAVLTPMTLYAAEESGGAGAGAYDIAEEHAQPDADVHNVEDVLDQLGDIQYATYDEPIPTETETDGTTEIYDTGECSYQLVSDENRVNPTGSLYALRLIAINGDIATAIISQCADGGDFVATSRNFTDWEIESTIVEWRAYYHGDESSPMPHINLAESGILRIERLPYLIDDRIIWVGFAITEDTTGNIYRRQIRLFADGTWLNPLPDYALPTLVGLEGFGWAREAIEFVVARNLMDMYFCPEKNERIAFNPTGKATRGDVLAAAIMALGLTPPDSPDIYHVPFADVPPVGRGVYIDIAKQLGLVAGIGNNQFAPNQIISRQDMMTMLYNILLAMGQIQPDTGLTALRRFNDVGQIAEYARLPISSLARAGIIAGNGISLNPRGYMTRVEAAMFVWNLGLIQNAV